MARKQAEAFFGNSPASFAAFVASYPEACDFEAAPGFAPDELKSAFPFVPEFGGASEAPLRPSRRDADVLDQLTAKAGDTAARAAEAAQAAMGRAMDAARSRAPELRAHAHDIGGRAVSGAGQAARDPRVRTGLIAAGAIVVVAGALWVTVPWALNAARSGTVSAAAAAISRLAVQWLDTTPDPGAEDGPVKAMPQPVTVTGPATALNAATVMIGERVVFLSGIEPVDHPGATQGFAAYLAQAGQLRCTLPDDETDEGECVNARGVNVAEAAVLSGMATARPGAPQSIRNAEREARQNRAGIWSMR